MKKYITIATLLAAGSAFANAAELVAHYAFNNNATDTTEKNSFAGIDFLTYAAHEGALDDLGAYLYCNDDSSAMWNGTTNGFTASNMAFSALIRVDTLPVGTDSEHPGWTAQWILGGGTTADGGPKLGIGSDGQLKFSLHNVGGALNSGTTSVVSTGDWCQIGFSLQTLSNDTRTLTLWLNGNAVVTTENYGYDLVWNNKMALVEGKDACANRFRGGLDEVKVWTVSSNDDVAELMSKEASAIPEPSTFGLLAGLGALALVASRRRRVKKA